MDTTTRAHVAFTDQDGRTYIYAGQNGGGLNTYYMTFPDVSQGTIEQHIAEFNRRLIEPGVASPYRTRASWENSGVRFTPVAPSPTVADDLIDDSGTHDMWLHIGEHDGVARYGLMSFDARPHRHVDPVRVEQYRDEKRASYGGRMGQAQTERDIRGTWGIAERRPRTTTTQADPLAYVRPGYDNTPDEANDRYTHASACSNRTGPGSLRCTRWTGHPGQHIGAGGRSVMGVWTSAENGLRTDYTPAEDAAYTAAQTGTTPTESADLTAYKAKVREVALRAKAENDWCESGFAAALAELGLAPMVRKHRAEFTITVEITGHDDDDDAASAIRAALEGATVGDVLITDAEVSYYDVEDITE